MFGKLFEVFVNIKGHFRGPATSDEAATRQHHSSGKQDKKNSPALSSRGAVK
jgi:ABC-type uncharacterized transport system involved in gliding motility auxiliary subunit